MTKPTETDAANEIERRLIAARRAGVFEPRDDARTAKGIGFGAGMGALLWLAVICAIAAVAMIITSGKAHSAEWRAVATVAALHSRSTYYCEADAKHHDYRGAIPGVGVGADFTPDTMMAGGVWRTSHGRTSAFGLLDWRPLHVGPVSVGIFTGVSGGYCRKGNPNSVLPLGGATLRADFDRFAVHMLVVPPSNLKPLTVGLAVSARI